MAYYLNDPYFYSAKCYPFVGFPTVKVGPLSNRTTKHNKRIEEEVLTRRMTYTAAMDDENRSRHLSLLRIKVKME